MATEDAREVLGKGDVTVVKADVVASLNPKICLGTSIKGGGRGLYAKEPIAKGEWVWKEMEGLESTPRTWDFIEALPEASRNTYLHFAYCTWGVWRGGSCHSGHFRSPPRGLSACLPPARPLRSHIVAQPWGEVWPPLRGGEVEGARPG